MSRRWNLLIFCAAISISAANVYFAYRCWQLTDETCYHTGNTYGLLGLEPDACPDNSHSAAWMRGYREGLAERNHR